MIGVTDIRLRSQQLAAPGFSEPEQLVSWMGAVQAQEWRMARWAVGMRMASGALGDVARAFDRGAILRTHILRPTWHYVAAEDIRWMLALSGPRVRSANESLGRAMDIPAKLYLRVNDLLVRILEGGRSLTKQAIREELGRFGIDAPGRCLTRFLIRAEADGIVCSGPLQRNSQTYALLDDRVPAGPVLPREEALALLARKYFRSHAPATPEDFAWWSGLPLTEARRAMELLGAELCPEDFPGGRMTVHVSWKGCGVADDAVHLLPPFDEYLISYKDRTAALDRRHNGRAFTPNGIFFPVVLYGGRIVGNWHKVLRGGRTAIETSFFPGESVPAPEQVGAAADRYRSFMAGAPEEVAFAEEE